MARSRSQVIVNTHEIIPGEFTRTPDYAFPAQPLRLQIEAAAGPENVRYLEATELAKAVTGDPITANMLLVGFAYQLGLLPLSAEAIRRAIAINGAAVDANIAAFEAGRQLHGVSKGKPLIESVSPSEARREVGPRCADR